MQTTAIGTVANSLPENEVILLTLLISKGYILFAELKNIPDNRAIFLLEIYSSDTILQASGISNLFLHAAIAEYYDTNR